MKFRSVFKALDGGHLDSALFGAHVKGVKEGSIHAKSEPTRLSRRQRGWLGRKGAAKSGRDTRRKADSDAGL